MFFVLPGKIRIQPLQGEGMKKIIGILALSCICILLGLSVKWSKEKDISLVDPLNKSEITVNML